MPNKSNKTPNAMSKLFGDFANVVARAAGKPAAFVIAAAIIVIWAATGPVFQYSDTWQLIINTGTTIVTFLMVFLIQNSQNRDSAAIQVKLDELIRSSARRETHWSALNTSRRKRSKKFEAGVKLLPSAAARLCTKWANGLVMLQIAQAVSI